MESGLPWPTWSGPGFLLWAFVGVTKPAEQAASPVLSGCTSAVAFPGTAPGPQRPARSRPEGSREQAAKTGRIRSDRHNRPRLPHLDACARKDVPGRERGKLAAVAGDGSTAGLVETWQQEQQLMHDRVECIELRIQHVPSGTKGRQRSILTGGMIQLREEVSTGDIGSVTPASQPLRHCPLPIRPCSCRA
jgi:hypothetical protein